MSGDRAFAWRAMRPADLADVVRIATLIHPDYPERPETFAEKRDLAPDCAWIAVDGSGAVAGYGFALPWRMGRIVPVDTLVGVAPGDADMLYICDVALLPEARGQGLGGGIVTLFLAAARRRGLGQLALMAVYGSDALWARHCFVEISGPEIAAAIAAYGPEARYMVRAVET